MTIIILGTILALVGLIVYYVSKKVDLKNEKAALENSKAAWVDKVNILEKERLDNEAKQRAAEAKAIAEFEALDDRPDSDFGDAWFYRVRGDKSDLN